MAEINQAERTVLRYVKLEFRGAWKYDGDTFSFRPVGGEAELLVVVEAPTGQLETSWFVVRPRPDPGGGAYITTDWVVVPREQNIVYIPERCRKRQDGDHTECIASVI